MQVLVELTGQTANNRLGVMALQPAPLQLTWIGYPNSTGLKAVQYRLTGTHAPLEACCMLSVVDSGLTSSLCTRTGIRVQRQLFEVFWTMQA